MIDIQEDYTSREAMAYLSQKLGKSIKPMTFYQWVHRGFITPISQTRKFGESRRFSKAMLDGFTIYSYQKAIEKPVLKAINGTTDMQELEALHGELINNKIATDLVRSLAHNGQTMSTDLVRAHLKRHVGAVGYVGQGTQKAVTHFYPRAKVEEFAKGFRHISRTTRNKPKTKRNTSKKAG